MSLARHGIKHVSPSSLNLWLANPHQWARRYLLKEKETSGPAMVRGTAVETGFAAWLRFEDIEAAVSMALSTFDQNMLGEVSEAIEKERSLIGPMLRQLASTPWPELNATQIKVEYWLDGIDVPCLGYVDFAFDGGDMDLKTTRACPSTARAPHVRQVAIYRAARNKPGRLLYVTDKKRAAFEVDDAMMATALQDMLRAARSLQHFLGKVDNPADAVACLPYNPDDFRSGPFVPRRTAAGFEPVEI